MISNPHLLLKKLILLTTERDAASLELSMAQVLFDLVLPTSVILYRVKDLEASEFLITPIGIEQHAHEKEIPADFMTILVDCFRSGEPVQHVGVNHTTSLYALKNVTGHAMSVVAIEEDSKNAHAAEIIPLLLQIYQNFTGLISDNEHDTLTGLLNRKTFDLKIHKVLTRIQRANQRNDDKGQAHFLTIFDIDHFKRINDEYGHLVGDEVLLLIAQMMTKTFREVDPVFRFGGEEFVVLFSCAQMSDIHIIIDRFNANLRAFDFPQIGKITVSAGYTEIYENDTPAALVDRADMALYYAKNHGRNRSCHYESLVASGELTPDKKEGAVELFKEKNNG